MRTKKTGILAGIMTACICVAQSVPAFGAQQDLVGFEPNTGSQAERAILPVRMFPRASDAGGRLPL